jgi:hypothetical protein
MMMVVLSSDTSRPFRNPSNIEWIDIARREPPGSGILALLIRIEGAIAQRRKILRALDTERVVVRPRRCRPHDRRNADRQSS